MAYLANAIGVLAVIIMVSSYQLRDKQKLLLCHVTARAMFVVQYLMLGALEGAVFDALAMFGSMLAKQKDSCALVAKHRTALRIGMSLLIAAAGLLLYEGPISLFPMIGVLFQTNALWMEEGKWIRRISLAGSPFWFCYNLSNRAYGTILGDLSSMASISIAIYRYDIKKQNEPVGLRED